MLKIGLTGGIASGKSSVARWLRDRGLPVFDADQATHELYAEAEGVAVIEREFGRSYIDNGIVNRILLGKKVFSDPDAKAKLERVIHPLVAGKMFEQFNRAVVNHEKLMIFDIPLLYEAGWEKYFDEVWLVYVPRSVQIQRLVTRDRIPREQAELRVSLQMLPEDKLKRADRVIDNSGNWQETQRRLEIVVSEVGC